MLEGVTLLRESETGWKKTTIEETWKRDRLSLPDAVATAHKQAYSFLV